MLSDFAHHDLSVLGAFAERYRVVKDFLTLKIAGVKPFAVDDQLTPKRSCQRSINSLLTSFCSYIVLTYSVLYTAGEMNRVTSFSPRHIAL